MLQPMHLAIVRAALTYWDEEMGAAPHSIYQHYLHSKDRETVFTPEDIAAARSYFNIVVHKYGLLDFKPGILSSTTLTDDGIALDRKPNQKIVSVLIH